MKLSDRIDRALAMRQLSAPKVLDIRQVAPTAVDPPFTDIAVYQTLDEAIINAEKLQPDENGLRICVISEIDAKNISLPLKVGKYIVEDIQPFSAGGYEVHFLANNQK